MKARKLVFVLICVLFLLNIPDFPVMAGTQPGIFVEHTRNWAGYRVDGFSNTVTRVGGAFAVPKVSCQKGENSATSFWAGLDFTSDIQQAGVDADCRHGTPRNWAWYETYPKVAVNLTNTNSLTLSPGDYVEVTISIDDVSPTQQYVAISIFVYTNGVSNLKWQWTNAGSAQVTAVENSAECIAEAPVHHGSITPLSNFGTAYFGSQFVTGGMTCSATVAGHSLNFGKFVGTSYAVVDEIILKCPHLVLARPGNLTADGGSFDVVWKHSGVINSTTLC